MAGPGEAAPPDGEEFDICNKSLCSLILFFAAGKVDEGKILSLQHDLSGHNGAVYSIKFNKRGNFLASGKPDACFLCVAAIPSD